MDVARLVELNAAYARVIDTEQFEAWPELFHDPCIYKVTTADNVARGLPSGIIYAESRGMLQDRIASPLSGWWGHADPFAFTTGYRPAAGITRDTPIATPTGTAVSTARKNAENTRIMLHMKCSGSALPP